MGATTVGLFPDVLFKVLKEDGSSYHGGDGKWNLPRDGQPGEPMPPIVGDLIAREHGYHLCRPQDLMEWLGPSIYLAQYRGERLESDNKIVVREARLLRRLETWDERIARLFAADCVERVLPVFEKTFPNDDRPRKAIAVVRQFANGEAARNELDAARAAARAAAWAARAACAAGAAERTWQTTRLLQYLHKVAG